MTTLTRPPVRWPTPAMLEQAGFVRCKTDGCRVYLDPVNVPQRKCADHQRKDRVARQQRRIEMRYAPRPTRSHRERPAA